MRERNEEPGLGTRPRVGVCSNLELQIFPTDWETSPANME